MVKLSQSEKDRLDWWDTRIKIIGEFLGSDYHSYAFDPDFVFYRLKDKRSVYIDKLTGERLYELALLFKRLTRQAKFALDFMPMGQPETKQLANVIKEVETNVGRVFPTNENGQIEIRK